MSKEFFKNFPITDYDGISLRNILLKSKIISDILNRNDIFHPFTIEDGERPDTVAYDYYGDSELYWIVLMSNNIVDPYYDWPMTQNEFRSYIVKKYGTVQAAMQEIIYWKHADYDYYMTPESKSLLTNDEIQGWVLPVYAFDWENESNEKRREIRLIDRGLVPQILSEIAQIYG